jgi:cytochrome c-type biogenesis protein CcmH/NrfG
MIACANVPTEKAGKTKIALTPSEQEAAKVEKQIARIEEKLKANPTVRGWILVGDAQMHLKKYNEAVWAYREAYMLSKFADGPRRKLRRAVALAGFEPENQRYEDK